MRNYKGLCASGCGGGGQRPRNPFYPAVLSINRLLPFNLFLLPAPVSRDNAVFAIKKKTRNNNKRHMDKAGKRNRHYCQLTNNHMNINYNPVVKKMMIRKESAYERRHHKEEYAVIANSGENSYARNKYTPCEKESSCRYKQNCKNICQVFRNCKKAYPDCEICNDIVGRKKYRSYEEQYMKNKAYYPHYRICAENRIS